MDRKVNNYVLSNLDTQKFSNLGAKKFSIPDWIYTEDVGEWIDPDFTEHTT